MKKGEMLSSALALMVKAHSGQFDKGGQPYALHALAVMHKLRTDDEELQCIALLHDIIEDTDTTYKDLIDIGMSHRVVHGVSCMTKMRGETYIEYKTKVLSNRDSMLVKSKDLLHNSDLRRLKGVSEKDVARVAKYMSFYSEIQERLKS